MTKEQRIEEMERFYYEIIQNTTNEKRVKELFEEMEANIKLIKEEVEEVVLDSKAKMEQTKRIAEEYRALLRNGHVDREEAKKFIMPYIDAFNQKSKEIAKKWNQRPRTITFAKFIR